MENHAAGGTSTEESVNTESWHEAYIVKGIHLGTIHWRVCEHWILTWSLHSERCSSLGETWKTRPEVKLPLGKVFIWETVCWRDCCRSVQMRVWTCRDWCQHLRESLWQVGNQLLAGETICWRDCCRSVQLRVWTGTGAMRLEAESLAVGEPVAGWWNYPLKRLLPGWTRPNFGLDVCGRWRATLQVELSSEEHVNTESWHGVYIVKGVRLGTIHWRICEHWILTWSLHCERCSSGNYPLKSLWTLNHDMEFTLWKVFIWELSTEKSVNTESWHGVYIVKGVHLGIVFW